MAERINSRKKGAKNERNLAKAFEKWTGIEFSRVPASGGLRWKGMQEIICGDIIPSGDIHFAIDFPFSIEAKAYADLNFKDPLLNNNSKLYDFWEQSSADAKRSNKRPLVFSRQNGMPKGLYFVQLSYDDLTTMSLDIYYHIAFDEDFVIMRSDDFFRSDYPTILKYLKLRDERKK